MTNEKGKVFDISHGPNNVYLSEALFKKGPYTVGFYLNGRTGCINVQILSIARVDGSGERFEISGVVVDTTTPQSSIGKALVKINLCTSTDSGTLQFLQND